MQRVFATAVVGLLLVGCAADSGWKVAYEQERTTRQEQDSRIRNLEAQQRQQPRAQQTPQPQPQQSPPQDRAMTRAESIAFCEKLNQAGEIAIRCEVFTMKTGTQVMSFVFPDWQTLTRSWEEITNYFAGQYCVSSLKMNIQAAIGQVLIKEDAFRYFPCQGNTWTEWDTANIQKPSNTRNQRY